VRFDTLANDPIWFRVVQGSHEEQHSFQVHGMRWRRFRGNEGSAIRNQQTFGISEAFTFLQEEPYGAGDYMYKLSSADDLWLGCWGLVRAFEGGKPGAPLALPQVKEPAAWPKPTGEREFHVTAVQKWMAYREPDLVDPFGMFYRLDKIFHNRKPVPVHKECADGSEPLILRCREGELVRIVLTNELEGPIKPEPFAPEVPVEERNPFSHRPERRVSEQVSMHADLVLYDVKISDGANVGRNLERSQSVAPRASGTYEWRTHRPPMVDANKGEPLGPLLLQDMADFRNHRHHGLIGETRRLSRDSGVLGSAEKPREAPPRRRDRQAAQPELHGPRRGLARIPVHRGQPADGGAGIRHHHRYGAHIRLQGRPGGRLRLSQRRTEMGGSAGIVGNSARWTGSRRRGRPRRLIVTHYPPCCAAKNDCFREATVCLSMAANGANGPHWADLVSPASDQICARGAIVPLWCVVVNSMPGCC
jgi:hypothetical protein